MGGRKLDIKDPSSRSNYIIYIYVNNMIINKYIYIYITTPHPSIEPRMGHCPKGEDCEYCHHPHETRPPKLDRRPGFDLGVSDLGC